MREWALQGRGKRQELREKLLGRRQPGHLRRKQESRLQELPGRQESLELQALE